MVDLSVIRDLVAILSFLIGLTYYMMVLRNQQRSRQIQIINSAPRPDNWGFMDWKVEDYDKFISKHGPEADPDGWRQFMIWFNLLENYGVYVREGLLDVRLVCLLSGGTISASWGKYRPIIYEWRRRKNRPRDFVEAEYLVEKVEGYFKKHPDLEP